LKDRHGDLADIGLPRLLHNIFLRKDEGAVLDIAKEPVKKRFFFRKGFPVAASSNILGEVLGRLLMQEGIITQKEYESSLEVVLRDKKKHGEVLISMGLISPQQLGEFLRLQLKRRLLKIFDWEEGSYRYVVTDLPLPLPANPLHPAELILEGISLGFYPVSRIKTDLKPYLETKLIAAGSPYKLDDFRLNLQEKRFIESLSAETSLGDALSSSDLLRHRALSIALSLIITNVLTDSFGAQETAPEISVEEHGATQPPEAQVDSKLNAELLFMKAKTSLQKKEFRHAIEILGEITNLSPGEGEYWAHLGWAIYNDDPGRIAEAEKLIKDSIDLNNDLDAAWLYLGRILLAQGRTEPAKKAFASALQKNAWNTEALSELKRLYINSAISDPFSHYPSEPALSGAQSAALEALLKAVRKHTGPVLIEDAEGSGKTTVLLELLKRLSQDKVLAAVLLASPARELELIKAINAEVGSQSEAATVKEQLLNLGMRVSQNKIQGGQNLIVIDEAHTLSPGCLKLIQYLTRLKTLQIALFSAPGLSERLKSPDFKELDERLAARLSLGGFSAEEASALIASRIPESVPLDAASIFNKTGPNPAALLKEASAVYERKKAASMEIPEEPSFDAPAPGQEVIEIGYDEFAFQPAPEEEKAIEPEQKPEAKPIEAPPAAIEAKAQRPAPPPQKEAPLPRPVETHREEAEPAEAEKPRKRGMLRLIFWIIVMLVAGLAAGSLIGTYWFNQGPAQEERAPSPPEPAQIEPPQTVNPPAAPAEISVQGPAETAVPQETVEPLDTTRDNRQ